MIEIAPGERQAWLAALERSYPRMTALLRALYASQDESRERRFLETREDSSHRVAHAPLRGFADCRDFAVLRF